MLRENIIETEDSFLSLGFNGLKNYIFFDVGDVYSYEKPPRGDILFTQEIFLDRNIILHSRSVYGILDLFGDVGGVLGILQALIGYFVAPYNETSFVLKVAQRKEGFCTKMALQMINSFKCAERVMPKKIVKLKVLYDEASERLMDCVNIQKKMEKNKDKYENLSLSNCKENNQTVKDSLSQENSSRFVQRNGHSNISVDYQNDSTTYIKPSRKKIRG